MPRGGYSAARQLIGLRYRIFDAYAPARTIAEIVLHDFGQIPEEDQDPFESLSAKLLDLVLQKWAPQNWHHRLRPIIGDRAHSGAASASKDDRLRWSVIKATLDTRGRLGSNHQFASTRSATRHFVMA